VLAFEDEHDRRGIMGAFVRALARQRLEQNDT
jgi:hypothetical protein